ncbi:hypothetical protein [Pseudomonas sp. Root562]|uniref:hypothetical protein n=1 Tax=Pseudomonas sp. Root562 TaxID=1736561 RepID=UPI0007039264|nr:hypothetical protein [Pseudomonas sp. Root562]KQZ83629.1 hypothetical protein ASD60_06285 [Pseudomonas sp. Root562]
MNFIGLKIWRLLRSRAGASSLATGYVLLLPLDCAAGPIPLNPAYLMNFIGLKIWRLLRSRAGASSLATGYVFTL